MNANFYNHYVLDDSLLKTVGFDPYYPHVQSGLNDPILIDKKPYINLAANNYLGLAMDPRVIAASELALKRYGVSMCGTPVATGAIDLYQELEQRIADFVGLEDAIIFPSCYQANNALFRAICNEQDVVVVDRSAHSSLIEGIKAVGCKIRPFLNNDVHSLEKNLRAVKSARFVFCVTESVFSTAGSIAPFSEMVRLASNYGAIPVVDDSHGIGVIGESGKGILSHQGLRKFAGIYTTSLGKALANAGGVIAGKASLIRYLRYYCSHLTYSTALPPAILAGTAKVLDILEEEGETILETVWTYRNMLVDGLREAGFSLSLGDAPIVSIAAGSSQRTLEFARYFFEHGILTTPFIYPSVPKNGGKVRLIAGANLKLDSLQKAIHVAQQAAKELL